MKEYVPIFFEWVEVTGELNAQEKGRLIDAIVLYAQGGDLTELVKRLVFADENVYMGNHHSLFIIVGVL